MSNNAIAGLLWLGFLAVLCPGCSVAPKSVQDKAADSRAEKEALLTQKLRCAQEAWRYDDRDKKELGRHLVPYLKIFYAYNAKLNTCLYEAGFVSTGPPYFESRYIVDLLTNETLAEYDIRSVPGKRSADDQKRMDDFAKQEKELLGRSSF
jgi:hypothetical protein